VAPGGLPGHVTHRVRDPHGHAIAVRVADADRHPDSHPHAYAVALSDRDAHPDPHSHPDAFPFGDGDSVPVRDPDTERNADDRRHVVRDAYAYAYAFADRDGHRHGDGDPDANGFPDADRVLLNVAWLSGAGLLR
jgi:hypothetical protein